MTHLDTFLTDILRQPNLDEPRLRYANWLDDRCSPLGEFIRIQIRLAHADEPHLRELERREQELLAEFESEWVGDLSQRVQWWVFRRGFVEEVALSGGQFLEHGPTLFQQFPIREMHLQDVGERLAAVTSTSTLEFPPFLDLSNNRVGDAGAKLLAQSSPLKDLTGLNLSCTGISNAGAEALAQSPHLAGLRELYLSNNRIGDAGVRALASSSALSQVNRLFLDYNSIGRDGEQLLQSRFGKRVFLR